MKLKIVSWMVMRDRGLNTEKSNNGSSLSTDQLSVVIFSKGVHSGLGPSRHGVQLAWET